MRVLVTGLGTFWGSRLAQQLEQRDDVEIVVGLDTTEPRLPLERTEFVKADSSYSILARIVRATEVDTVLHTHLLVDSTQASGRALHEINVIGTMNLLAAAGTAGSTVRKVVVKSSALVYGANFQDPCVFSEDMDRTRAARTPVERSLLESARFFCAFFVIRRFPLPPLLTIWALEPLRFARVLDLPPEMLALLRYGRVVDNHRFKRAGYRYRYSTIGTVDAFARGMRLERSVGDSHPSYRYERDVESFFRHSPAVIHEP